MSVKLVSITPNAEKVIMYCARCSNPKNQESNNSKLLKYCLDHGHVSIFEMANMVLEIETSMPIAAQILRHRSFSFQQFSQRYADVRELGDMFIQHDARSQDLKNRQNSNDDCDDETKFWFDIAQQSIQNQAKYLYEEALDKGIAKEQARFLLPQSTKTRMYMNGTIRSWIHYINLRQGNGTQKEHIDIAEQCKLVFKSELPIIAEAMGW